MILLKKMLTKILEELKSLGTQITTVSGHTTSLDGRTTTLEGQASTMSGQITTLNGKATTLEGQVAALDGDLTSLQGDVTDLDGDMSAVDGRVTTAGGQSTSLDGRMTAAEGQITNINALLPQYQWAAAEDTVTVNANAGYTHTFTDITMPAKNGWGRQIIARCSNDKVGLCGWTWDANNHPQIIVRNLTSSSTGVIVRVCCLYLKNENIFS